MYCIGVGSDTKMKVKVPNLWRWLIKPIFWTTSQKVINTNMHHLNSEHLSYVQKSQNLKLVGVICEVDIGAGQAYNEDQSYRIASSWIKSVWTSGAVSQDPLMQSWSLHFWTNLHDKQFSWLHVFTTWEYRILKGIHMLNIDSKLSIPPSQRIFATLNQEYLH